ncbi:MAG: hypothetical protein J6D20_07645 [Clostridia bacterium]|nr:hypothetical protein [Clostridia bacterium]
MKTKRITQIFLCLALLIVMGGEMILSAFSITASAESTGYTNVLTDLQKDSSFNPDNYPAKEDDTSVQVIHIAEGENGELFIYVYQPCDAKKDYKAKFINMSLQNPVEKNLQYKLYSLTWLNSNGVFDKYIVNDFTVTSSAERYYNIATVYRPYDKTVDTSSEAIDNIQCKGFAVGQYWKAYYYNNVLFYEAKHIDVVDIEIQATGTVRYTEGFKLYVDSCDSHYVAFSIKNYNVEQIYDADITYTINNYEKSTVYTVGGGTTTKLTSSEKKDSEYLSAKEVGSNDGDGWLGKKYSWYRITDVTTFKKQVEEDSNDTFSQEELDGLAKSQFVFRFAETEYRLVSSPNASVSYYSEAVNIGVLRLHFLSDGQFYNLGCVSDLVGTDSIPELTVDLLDNIENMEIWEKLYALLCLIVFLIILSFFFSPIKAVLKVIWEGIKFIFSMLCAIITLPIQLIQQAFSKDKPHRKRKRR